MMNKSVARFITRMQGEGDGLFIGSVFQGGKELFKPNTVYEIRDVLGTLTIVEVGEGQGTNSGSGEVYNSPGVLFHWGQEIGNILDSWHKYIFLTRDEYKQYVDARNAARMEMD
jgi:hypothetical protein